MSMAGTGAADLWRVGIPQEFRSDGTAVRIVPRVFSRVVFLAGTRNADIGGGRFGDVTGLLAARGVENVVYDPFNRPAGENALAAARLRGGQADTATVCNVLNVVRERVWRDRAIAQAADALRPGGAAYFQVHEGDRSGRPAATSRGWQENRRLASYVPEVCVHFEEVAVHGGILFALRPRRGAYHVDGGDHVTSCASLEQAVETAARRGGAEILTAYGPLPGHVVKEAAAAMGVSPDAARPRAA